MTNNVFYVRTPIELLRSAIFTAITHFWPAAYRSWQLSPPQYDLQPTRYLQEVLLSRQQTAPLDFPVFPVCSLNQFCSLIILKPLIFLMPSVVPPSPPYHHAIFNYWRKWMTSLWTNGMTSVWLTGGRPRRHEDVECSSARLWRHLSSGTSTITTQ